MYGRRRGAATTLSAWLLSPWAGLPWGNRRYRERGGIPEVAWVAPAESNRVRAAEVRRWYREDVKFQTMADTALKVCEFWVRSTSGDRGNAGMTRLAAQALKQMKTSRTATSRGLGGSEKQRPPGGRIRKIRDAVHPAVNGLSARELAFRTTTDQTPRMVVWHLNVYRTPVATLDRWPAGRGLTNGWADQVRPASAPGDTGYGHGPR